MVSDNRKALFLEKSRERTRHFTVVLEDIFQPHNASAVLRSCDCFGVQDVHVIENTNRFEPIETISLGASQWLNIHRYADSPEGLNTKACYDALHAQGYRVYATSPHKNGIKLEELPVDQPFALVFGQEQNGLTEAALEMADGYVEVPMYGFTESLNISVCAAVCLHHIRYRLETSDLNFKLSPDEVTQLLMTWCVGVIPSGELVIQRLVEKFQH